MLSAFLNPFTIIAGSALVLTPIIIHLINRIRFRRVKWAAMEFLLKAQKKMRRKKILEQLLLLLLRCLLVFLAGVLFARFIGCDSGKGKESRPTTHLVILDDTPSMADKWRRDDGAETNSYAEAKRLVYERIMPAAAEARPTRRSTWHQTSTTRTPNTSSRGREHQDRSAEEIREAARSREHQDGGAALRSPSTNLVDGLQRRGTRGRAARATARAPHLDLRSPTGHRRPAIAELLKAARTTAQRFT